MAVAVIRSFFIRSECAMDSFTLGSAFISTRLQLILDCVPPNFLDVSPPSRVEKFEIDDNPPDTGPAS